MHEHSRLTLSLLVVIVLMHCVQDDQCADAASPKPPITAPTPDTPTPDVPTSDGSSAECGTDDDCATNADSPYCDSILRTCTSLLPDGADCSDPSDCQRSCLDSGACGARPAGATCTYNLECGSDSCQVSCQNTCYMWLLALVAHSQHACMPVAIAASS